MSELFLSTAQHEPAQATVHTMGAEFPGVALRLGYHHGWRLRAHGPHGSLSMILPRTLRAETLRAACRMVSEDNCAPAAGQSGVRHARR